MAGMKIDLTDDEAQALRALLLEKTNLPTKFRQSTTQGAYRSILEKFGDLADVCERYLAEFIQQSLRAASFSI
jgi:hypothetical protein